MTTSPKTFHSFLLAPLTALLVTGCSDKATTPDAQIKVTDASTADAAPDAFSCAAPLTACDMECVDLQTSVNDCGACGTACVGGKVCQAGACACPPPFVPAMLEPSDNDQFPAPRQGVRIAITPFGDANGLHLGIAGYSETAPVLNQDIALSGTLGAPPFFILGYKFALPMSVQAAFYSTAGKIRFTKACAQGASGVLTGVTFTGITSLSPPFMIDPNGCSFEVASLPFAIGKPDMCPGPL
jgi:hypothetical protein